MTWCMGNDHAGYAVYRAEMTLYAGKFARNTRV